MTTKPATITENTAITLPLSVQLKLIGSVIAVVAGAMFYISAIVQEFRDDQSLTNKKVNYLELIIYSGGKINAQDVKKLRDEDLQGLHFRGDEPSTNLKLVK